MATVHAFLVEDNPLIRANVCATLAELVGVETLGWAADEPTARAWLAAHTDWDLAIIDMFLEKGNGLGVLEALSQRGEHQYAVVLTNYATADIRARCERLGADAVFDKSHEIDQLLSFCEQLATGSPPRHD
ncbi:response regulator [Xylophilus sp. ASV27]|uniref:response regulator n=1 Tax=Xylophilus sp. ASV27 TaxID=2795129 RepID=UPI001E598184|nr:response regulator [Xylophilus sp. ASV27]